MKRIWLWMAAGMAVANVAAADTVYRWKDAGGQLNYGTQPPPGVKAEPLGDRGNVTVVPAPAVAPAASGGTAARVERLERELEEERRLRREQADRTQEEEARRAQARADCEREYREPCDEEGRPLGSTNVIVVPRTYRGPYGNPPPYGHDGRPDKGPHGGKGDGHGNRPPPGSGKPQPSPPPKASVRAGTVQAEERLVAPR